MRKTLILSVIALVLGAATAFSYGYVGSPIVSSGACTPDTKIVWNEPGESFGVDEFETAWEINAPNAKLDPNLIDEVAVESREVLGRGHVVVCLDKHSVALVDRVPNQ